MVCEHETLSEFKCVHLYPQTTDFYYHSFHFLSFCTLIFKFQVLILVSWHFLSSFFFISRLMSVINDILCSFILSWKNVTGLTHYFTNKNLPSWKDTHQQSRRTKYIVRTEVPLRKKVLKIYAESIKVMNLQKYKMVEIQQKCMNKTRDLKSLQPDTGNKNSK